MSARPCLDSMMVDAHCATVGRLSAEADREDALHAAVAAEIRAIFLRGFNGESVLLPRVEGNPAREVQKYSMEDAILDAVSVPGSVALRAILNWQHPAADKIFQEGCFREAVIDNYLKEVADDIVEVRMAAMDRDAAEDRAFARFGGAL